MKVDNSDNEWRVFCALELPPELQKRNLNHVRKLRDLHPEVKASWSRPENIHLTLKFFGNVARERVDKIAAAATRAVSHFTPFTVAVGGTGVFPKMSQPRVLWIGVSDPDHNLSRLQRRFEDECSDEDFAKEDRAFKPHLTIARIRTTSGARALAEDHLNLKFDPVTFAVKELVVVRSELSSTGSIYTPLSRAALMSDKL